MEITRLTGAPGGAGEFRVPSRSFPGEAWRVTWVGPGACWCPCPRFGRRQTCRHAEETARAVAVEARDTVRASTSESRAAAAERLGALEEMFS